MSRVETDSLGQRALPDYLLYGINTLRGLENFDISAAKISDQPELIRALASIKKAAARANAEIGALPDEKARAITQACDEILAGAYADQFVINLLEGSGGTSINMNVNEVLANRALQILGRPSGDYAFIHPNDHVNRGQSTNDVLPSAVKLAVYEKSGGLIEALRGLVEALDAKAAEFAHVLKIGRTCMQAAQPMTLGQEFSGYAAALRRVTGMIDSAMRGMLILPLGGTAIGTGLGAAPGYLDAVYRHLRSDLRRAVRPAENHFDGLQNADGFARVSSEIRIAAEVIGKISCDLIILSSDARSGIGEIKLPAVQPGSSIMPGKVNPVLPMMMQQISYAIVGNDATVSLASLGGQLEINHFEPVIASRIFDSIDLLTRGSRLFTTKCVCGVAANEEQALENLLSSPALATVLAPQLGYAKTSAIVRQAEETGQTFIDVAVDMNLLNRDQIIVLLHAAAGIEPPGN